MSAPRSVTNPDYTVDSVYDLTNKSQDPRQVKRLLAVALRMSGQSPKEVADILRMSVQWVRNWTVRFNEGGPDALKDKPRSGRPAKLTDDESAAVRDMVEVGPDIETDGLTRWRLADLCREIRSRFGASLSKSTVHRRLKKAGYSHVSSRPIHPKADPAKQRVFRETFLAEVLKLVPPGTDRSQIEIWNQDEARVGQKGMLTRVWARKGVRPRVIRDHRYGYVYLFAATCAETGKAIGHVCDKANTTEMNRHLRDISKAVAPGKVGVLVLDGAGWHKSRDLEKFDNLALMYLPPYSPELNPVEQVIDYLKSNFWANRIFQEVEDVWRAVTDGWKRLKRDKKRVTSITTRSWSDIKKPQSEVVLS